jgi:hypothetical protein
MDTILIDKLIGGKIYKTAEYFVNYEKNVTDTLLDLYYEVNYDINLEDIIKENIIVEDLDTNILDYISVEIITVEYKNDTTLKSIHPYYQKYKDYLDNFNKSKEKYERIKQTWYKLSSRYNQKLSELINNKDTRLELINYIEEKSLLNPAIKLLKTDFIIPPITFDEIAIYKNDINSIYYWVTLWKDAMLTFIKSIRPKFTYKVPSYVYPTSILVAVDPMVPYWFKFNQNMNLYLIKFNFTSHEKIKLRYKNNYNEWISCKRVVNENGPSCQPI